MKSQTVAAFVLLFATTVLAVEPLPAHAQDAETVFQRLQAKYDTLESLRADFTQTMTSTYSDDTAYSSGTLLLSNDRYRVETEDQTIVSDGTTTWIYVHSEQQVLINDAIQDETTFSPTEFFQHYDERYEATDVAPVQLDDESHYRLHLQPTRSDSFFREMTLWLRDRDTLVTRLDILDVNETRMTFDLKNITVNIPLEGNPFTFTPPDGVEIVDLRSE